MVNSLSSFANSSVEAFNNVINDKTCIRARSVLYHTTKLVAMYSSPLFFGAGLLAGLAYGGVLVKYSAIIESTGHRYLEKIFKYSFSINLTCAAAFTMNRFVSTEKFANILGKINLANYAPNATKVCAFSAKYLPAVTGFGVGVELFFRLDSAVWFIKKVSKVHKEELQAVKRQEKIETLHGKWNKDVGPLNEPTERKALPPATWLNAVLHVWNKPN